MSQVRLPGQLQALTTRYRFVRDTNGMSPCQVYRLIGDDETLYLKVSDHRFRGTTYDVGREKDVILWLQGKLPVPEVLAFEEYEQRSFLLMREVRGDEGWVYYQQHRDLDRMIVLYCEGLALLQSVSIADCPFVSDVDFRLRELVYLLQNGLADVNIENWEEDNPFSDPDELFAFLMEHRPKEEELTFSHGDFGDSNVFIENHRISGFVDLGRGGKADKWYDIAFAVRSIRELAEGDEAYVDLFFERLGIAPDWEKLRYYILLDELF